MHWVQAQADTGSLVSLSYLDYPYIHWCRCGYNFAVDLSHHAQTNAMQEFPPQDRTSHHQARTLHPGARPGFVRVVLIKEEVDALDSPGPGYKQGADGSFD